MLPAYSGFFLNPKSFSQFHSSKKAPVIPPSKPNPPTFPLLQSSLIITLLNPLHTPKPRNPTLTPNLHPRFQLCIMQTHIIHRAHPRNTQPRKPAAASVHQRATVLAKVVCHCVAAGNSGGAGVGAKGGFAAEVGERRVLDDEGGGEDAGGEFAAVEAVADEHLGEVLAFDWLCLWQKKVSY